MTPTADELMKLTEELDPLLQGSGAWFRLRNGIFALKEENERLHYLTDDIDEFSKKYLTQISDLKADCAAREAKIMELQERIADLVIENERHTKYARKLEAENEG